ncbi:MAG: hypothetical protein BGP16_12770 [Sphingobium sp. 66-54]|nr:MAG: hypothetical protein BGP16_12770 [Sphingobium sp. 66-54]
MIVIRVELWSAVTGEKSELARMHICNEGGTERVGNYSCRTLHGRSAAQLDKGRPQRTGSVTGHRRLDLHVWHLVAKALAAMGYGEK